VHYVDNMERLLRKFDTAKRIVPHPVRQDAAEPTALGVIYYGSTSPAMSEAVELLAEQGVGVDLLRVRAFPFDDDVLDFVVEHEQVFVVEQNRDAQLRTLLVNECEIDPKKLTRVLHYEGTPITARFIADAIAEKAASLKIVPFRKTAP
jgi:2-oxoglutarate/2-oxoacid ferredoxin oxidoreductase subunit alpha